MEIMGITLENQVVEKFLYKYYDSLNWKMVAWSQNLSEQFIKDNSDRLKWKYLGINPNLPLDFIERNFKKFDWCTLTKSKKLPFDFLLKILQKFEGDKDYDQKRYIFYHNAIIPEDYIEQNLSLVDWEAISLNNNFSEDFFKKHLCHLHVLDLGFNLNVSHTFLWNHYHQMRGWWLLNLLNVYQESFRYKRDFYNYSYEYFKPQITVNTKFKLLDKNPPPNGWIYISLDLDLPVWFAKKYLGYMDAEDISSNGNLVMAFFEKNPSCFEIRQACCNNFERQIKILNKKNIFNRIKILF